MHQRKCMIIPVVTLLLKEEPTELWWSMLMFHWMMEKATSTVKDLTLPTCDQLFFWVKLKYETRHSLHWQRTDNKRVFRFAQQSKFDEVSWWRGEGMIRQPFAPWWRQRNVIFFLLWMLFSHRSYRTTFSLITEIIQGFQFIFLYSHTKYKKCLKEVEAAPLLSNLAKWTAVPCWCRWTCDWALIDSSCLCHVGRWRLICPIQTSCVLVNGCKKLRVTTWAAHDEVVVKGMWTLFMHTRLRNDLSFRDDWWFWWWYGKSLAAHYKSFLKSRGFVGYPAY